MEEKVQAKVKAETIQILDSHLQAQEERKRSWETEKHQVAVPDGKVSST